MKRLIGTLFLLLVLQPGYAQLSVDQKVVDFQQLAALYAKRYAFYEWKRDALQYDGLNLAPWIDRIKKTQTDVEFFDLCTEYVARYQDGHSTFLLPSSFIAWLGLTVDIYSGKILIDSIERTILPESDFPFQVGDELLAIDSRPVADVIREFMSLIGDGNRRTIAREAAALLTVRYQDLFPRAYEIGATATLLIQRRGASAETYVVPWIKMGEPYTVAGPVLTPTVFRNEYREKRLEAAATTPWPSYMDAARKFQNFHVSRFSKGKPNPVFKLPDSFTLQSAGLEPGDLLTGTVSVDGKRIGYMRIPSFDYISTRSMQKEIAYLTNTTDGLVVDVMGNPGGSGCVTEWIAQNLMPGRFRSLGMSIRPTWEDVQSAQNSLAEANLYGGTEDEIAELESIARSMRDAFMQSRGLTTVLPICGISQDLEPATDAHDQVIGYAKPIMLLVDEFSASAAELFAAILQDNKRALVYGIRTDGAGGAIEYDSVGFYMEAGASVTRAILFRKDPVTTPEYPAAPYIENIGVRPDIVADYMTEENLLNGGQTFVDGFLKAMADYINTAQWTTPSPDAVSARARQRPPSPGSSVPGSSDTRNPRPPSQPRPAGKGR